MYLELKIEILNSILYLFYFLLGIKVLYMFVMEDIYVIIFFNMNVNIIMLSWIFYWYWYLLYLYIYWSFCCYVKGSEDWFFFGYSWLLVLKSGFFVWEGCGLYLELGYDDSKVVVCVLMVGVFCSVFLLVVGVILVVGI